MKKISSEELSELPTLSRVSKLGTAGIAAIIGLISVGITLFFSIDNYQMENSINNAKQEKIQIINESSTKIESQGVAIREIINNTEDPELREKLNEYQMNIEKYIEESREANKLLEKDVERSYKGSIFNIGIISVAYAAETEGPKLKKQNVLWAILILLALVYLGALYSLLFSKNSNNIDIATDLVKTLTGFYIGIATSVVA